MKKIDVTAYELASPKIHDETVFVFLSDLHGLEHGPANSVLLEAIDRIHPDAVLVGGDMLLEREDRPYRVPLGFFKALAAEHTVYAANGNHEMRLSEFAPDGTPFREDRKPAHALEPEDWDPQDRTLLDAYSEEVRRRGCVMLRDEAVVFEKGGTRIRISALELERLYYPKGRNLYELAPGLMERHLGPVCDDGAFELLLAHHPNYLKDYAAWGADCVLAGHIHGGAVRLPGVGGLLSPNFTFFPRYSKGRYDDGDCAMFVSAGLGEHTFRLRINDPREIVVLRLVPSEAIMPGEARRAGLL